MQASDLKINSTFEMDGSIYVALEVRHIQQPRLASFMSIKYRNVETGNVFESRFNPGDKLGDAQIEKKEMQFLYKDDNLYYFMDTQTYDQIPLDEKIVADAMKYIKENGTVTINFALGRVISVTPPLFVELQIIDTEPGFSGNTATNATKPGKLETGFSIRIPLFVNIGEVIKVDTRTGDYVERVK